MSAIGDHQTPEKASLLYDPKIRGIVWQGALLLLVVWLAYSAVTNAIENLQKANIASGLGFWNNIAGFDIGQRLIDYSAATGTYGRAFWVGLLNTLLVAVIGCVLATFLGFAIGIARLSSNWVVRKVSEVYVEVIRNVPLLLQLYVWYAALTQLLPADAAAPEFLPGVFLSKSGLHFPVLPDGGAPLFVAAAGGLIFALALRVWLNRRQTRTGALAPIWPVLLVVAIPVLLALGYLLATVSFDIPERKRFGFSGGGAMTPEMTALVIGLSLYNAAFIAEILRGGILSVAKGQIEAASALGLRGGQILRLVAIPQALRVAVPPLASQYLNLAKNSSLAIAIGYPDLMSIGSTIINQTGQAIEVIAIVMGVYLAISLSISIFMNWYNARIARTSL